MAANATGSVYWGSYPAIDNTKYYSGGAFALPASQGWTIWGIVRFHHLLLGTDQYASSGSAITIWGNNGIGNAGGNDTWIGVNPTNFGTPSSALKISCRVAVSGVVAHSSGSTMVSSSVLVSKNKSYVIAVRYDAVASKIELLLCEQGQSAAVIATSASNATFVGSARTISGTKRIGYANFGNEIQQWGFAKQAFSDADITSLAAGADPESIVTVAGNRGWLANLNTPAATITPTWGTGDLTQNGTWTNTPTASPLIPASGGTYLTCNEPTPFRSYGLAVGSHATTVQLSGSYNGFTPSNLQAQILNYDGSVAQAWTTMSSQTIGSGAWSASISISEGSRYTLQIRDSVSGNSWSGSHPFHVCPVQLAIGQSPEVRMALAGKGTGTLVGSGYLMVGDEIVVLTTLNTGLGYIEMLNQLSLSTSVPVLILPAAITGTSSTQWAAKTAGLWDLMLAMATASKASVFYVTWLNSAADSSIPTNTIIANHGTIYSNLATDIGALGATYTYEIDKPNRDTGNSGTHRVAQAQRTFCLNHADYLTKVFIGAQYFDTQMDAEGTCTTSTYTVGVTNDDITLPLTPENEQFAATVSGTIVIAGNSYTVPSGSFSQSTGKATITGHFSPPLSGTVSVLFYCTTPHQIYSAAGNGRMGRRRGQHFAKRWGWAAKGAIGPVIQSVTYPAGGYAGTLTGTVSHNAGTALQTPNSGTGATNVFGFEVSEDNFSTFKTCTVSITAANRFQISVSSPVTTPANLAVRYAYMGGYPVQASQFQSLKDMLYDNSGISDQGGAPVEPTYDSIAVTQAAATSSAVRKTIIARTDLWRRNHHLGGHTNPVTSRSTRVGR